MRRAPGCLAPCLRARTPATERTATARHASEGQVPRAGAILPRSLAAPGAWKSPHCPPAGAGRGRSRRARARQHSAIAGAAPRPPSLGGEAWAVACIQRTGSTAGRSHHKQSLKSGNTAGYGPRRQQQRSCSARLEPTCRIAGDPAWPASTGNAAGLVAKRPAAMARPLPDSTTACPRPRCRPPSPKADSPCTLRFDRPARRLRRGRGPTRRQPAMPAGARLPLRPERHGYRPHPALAAFRRCHGCGRGRRGPRAACR